MTQINWKELVDLIPAWTKELGFADVGITDTSLEPAGQHLLTWLKNKFHGEMAYMERHGEMRWQPEKLHPGTLSIIVVRLNYLEKLPDPETLINNNATAYISRYALGRDYHKVIRQKLKHLTNRIQSYCEDNGFMDFDSRVFTDSAPLLEKAIAEKAGLGWIGKNTLLLNEEEGSWFFLGEVLTNLPLTQKQVIRENRCGSCSACIDICPTQAIVAPYTLDATRCISYLTIEKRGEIPVELRKPMGRRVFGCDDCQVVCPWNRYATNNSEPDFSPRHGLDDPGLVQLFEWREDEFLRKTEGSAIRRTGFTGWLRNLSVGLGNMEPDREIIKVLEKGKGHSDLVDEHIDWAIQQHQRGISSS